MSTAAKTPPTEVNLRETPGPEDYFDVVRDSNPFAANRVTEPSPHDVDVPAIHAASFDRLVGLADRVCREQSGIGVALLAGAGIGKSHLLSRLYRWSVGPAQGSPAACFVYVQNVLADPERLPRYLLKYVVSRLTDGGRGPLHATPLFRFIDAAIRRATAANPQARQADAFLSSFGRSDVSGTLLQFYRYARPEKADDRGRRICAEAALAWLSGDEVDPTLALRLDLKNDGQAPVMLADDYEVEQVLLALARLAGISDMPFILCIDQIENLDPDKLKPLVRFLHTLLDHAGNMLVISSGVKQTLLAYREDNVIPEAAWDRIAQYKVELKRIGKDDARRVLEARLERFHEPFMALDIVRRHVGEDTLFPLGRAWLATRLGEVVDVRPRDILTWARDAWEDEQGRLAKLGGEAWCHAWPEGEAPKVSPTPVIPPHPDVDALIDAAVDRKIEEQVAQHRLQPGSLPPDAGNLAGLVESLLVECKGEGLPYTFRGIERMKKKGGKLPPYDLLVRERREPDGREVTTGVLFITNTGLSASASLRRLLEDDAPPNHRILVTDQERRPLKVGAQGVEYYNDLKKQGTERFEHIKINFEQYAHLDALREVVGMAKSGDLEIETTRGTSRPVTEAEAIASHHRRDRYRGHSVLRPLLTEDPTPVPPVAPEYPSLDEKDIRQFIMGQLAWQMGSTAKAMARGYVGALKGKTVTPEAAWPQVKEVAGKMHVEGLVHATPQDDDLFLLLGK